MQRQAKQDNRQSMDWKRIFGILLTLAAIAGSAVVLVYAWTIQMMLRYARHDLSDGFWIFLICVAGLLVSVIVGYAGVRTLRRPQA
jgi:amino acid transporter